MKLSSDRGAVVLDPFLGSGTTLIACEGLGRRCRGFEIDPRYADVIVERWQETTGEQAVLDGAGETFGQVACIARVRDLDEVVALANDTPYGLGATVFGGDVEKTAEVARRLDAGMIGINKSCGGAAGTPWVGAKQSGYGYHSGKDGHRQFTQPRVVSMPR